MIQEPNFNLSSPSVTPKDRAKPGQKLPLSGGVWQKEALDTVGMYGAKEGNFSPVPGTQLTLFPIDDLEVKPPTTAQLDAPDVPIPHWGDFRFLGKDSKRLGIQPVAKPEVQDKPAKAEHPKDANSLTKGELLVDGVTQMKEDQFPGRVKYTEGGLYPAGDRKDKEVIKQHSHAPNYRKVPGKPIHGVGQPTEKGFKDVLDHIGAKDKPVVWTNTRAEAVVYIEGKPYNLREFGSFENLVLKEGATGADVEALEQKLKQKLLEKGKIKVPIENPGDGPKFKEVTITKDNIKTTEEVVDGLKSEGYKVEYKRIPLADEKSPTPAQMDELRRWTNEAQKKHPDANLEYVFNCHQGRGRTTTAMVTTGITRDGKTKQLELPFGVTLGEDARGRADRIIDESYHLQNLRETVDTTKKDAADWASKAEKLEAQAAKEADEAQKSKLEAEAAKARKKQQKYEMRATDFTKRYATMQKYSEYVDEHGPRCEDPSFEKWMSQEHQVKDLGERWAALNTQLGLENYQTVAAA